MQHDWKEYIPAAVLLGEVGAVLTHCWPTSGPKLLHCGAFLGSGLLYQLQKPLSPANALHHDCHRLALTPTERWCTAMPIRPHCMKVGVERNDIIYPLLSIFVEELGLLNDLPPDIKDQLYPLIECKIYHVTMDA